jgi:hypothetical protein
MRLKQLLLLPLSILLALFAALPYLLSVLIALVTFSRHSDWKILYRGSAAFDRDSRMRVSGTTLTQPIMFEAASGHQYVSQGELDVALPPAGSILFELMQKDSVCEFQLNLSEVLSAPLFGYIEVQVDWTEVRVTVHRYQWGREVSFNNGGTHRRTKMLLQKKYPWKQASRSVDDLHREQYAAGGELDTARFNAQFRDA